MPRQNTSPSDFPPAVLAQIAALAERMVTARKAAGVTQSQWAQKLGISQPTVARLERGDPSVSAATYIMCLWQLNPALDLTVLLPERMTGSHTANVPQPHQPCKSAKANPAAMPSEVDDFAALLARWSPQR